MHTTTLPTWAQQETESSAVNSTARNGVSIGTEFGGLYNTEQVRGRRYRFVVAEYAFMSERVHLLISELKLGNPSLAMRVSKQGFA